ncbi:MAG: glutathione peroxidase [Myxococcota bacterium]
MRAGSLLAILVLVACDAKSSDSDVIKTAPARTAPAQAVQAQPGAPGTPPGPRPGPVPNDALVDHAVKLLDGTEKNLSDYRGKALLVVNTASECGYTPQYADLQELYGKYKDRGFEVLAFPSNDFGGQEPGTSEQIRDFVDTKYSVEFEMFDKVVIKGPDKAPLYKTLTEQTAEGIRGEVEWNFTKFLVDPQGRVVQRFDSSVKPTAPEVFEAIEQVLPRA